VGVRSQRLAPTSIFREDNMTEAQARSIDQGLRRAFNLPDDWHMVEQDEEYGWVAGVALNMHAEDTGGPESGPSVSVWPSRYVLITGGEKGMYEQQGIPVFYAVLIDTENEESWTPRAALREVNLGWHESNIPASVVALVNNDPEFKMDREVQHG
jgi:hypothetical protein